MSSYRFIPGLKVFKKHDATPYEVIAPINMRACVVKNLNTEQLETALISDFTPEQKNTHKIELTLHTDEQWEEAKKRYEIISPILEKAAIGEPITALVEHAAKKHNSGSASIWRWIRAWRNEPQLSSLISQKTGIAEGSERLNDTINHIINDVIENYYLTSQKRSIASAAREVASRCHKMNIKAPHPNTVRKRIEKLPIFRRTKYRDGRKKLEANFAPSISPFPDAHQPLSVYQVDHTPADLIIVDEISREPIGRPWITAAIDVNTRIVAGIYVTLDKPSAISVGMCLAHAFLPKDKWLAERGIESEWPIWGLPQMIHADNAKEFRGGMLKRACEQYSIDLTWRPVARPNFGAHIERLLGTFSKAIKELPGTTFSSVAERGSYRSEKKASLTLAEFEKWLTIYITNVYHKRYHSTLMMSPLAKLEEGIFGNEKIPGIGLPRRITNESKLLIDLMPSYKRTVQRYGIKIDDINYFSHSIVPWINERDPQNSKKKRRFTIRRDPRDISQVYFYDPVEKDYLIVPYRNISNPRMTLSELKALKKKLKEQGLSQVDEDSIFNAYDEMTQLVEEAKHQTRSTKRKRQQTLSKHAKKKSMETQSAINETYSTNNTTLNTESHSSLFDEPIQPFSDVTYLPKQ